MIGTPMPDPDRQARGWLALLDLPEDVQQAEDATADADHQRGKREFTREATPTERLLLRSQGFDLPPDLTTTVDYHGVLRRRTWPQLDKQQQEEGTRS